ncbi:MAG TPA: hypothetical protein VGL26_11920 [Jatrophihabitans sp.]|jgi:hypothetical protein
MTLTAGDVAALARQAVDLLAEDVDVKLEPQSSGDDPYRMAGSTWVVWPLIDGERRFGIWIQSSSTAVEVLARLIDGLSNDASETTRFWGQPFPLCPGHPHPAKISETTGEVVVLRCPATKDIVAQIRPAF